MSGRFSDLKPDSELRQKFWEANQANIRELLEEVNKDVFDGRGRFKDERSGSLPSLLFRGIYRKPPPLTKPYLFLEVTSGAIAVCTASSDTLRVIAEDARGSCGWQGWNCNPTLLDVYLRAAVKYVVH